MFLSPRADDCWILERIPGSVEDPAYILDSEKEAVTFGRRIGDNDIICSGQNVSRRHLKFIRWDCNCRVIPNFSLSFRIGSSADLQRVSWSILDMGGVVGTFVNMVKVDPNIPHSLNSGDLIGVGCPENLSCREEGKETFVFRIHSPNKLCKEEDLTSSFFSETLTGNS